MLPCGDAAADRLWRSLPRSRPAWPAPSPPARSRPVCAVRLAAHILLRGAHTAGALRRHLPPHPSSRPYRTAAAHVVHGLHLLSASACRVPRLCGHQMFTCMRNNGPLAGRYTPARARAPPSSQLRNFACLLVISCRSWCWPPTSSCSLWPWSPSWSITLWSGTPRSSRRR